MAWVESFCHCREEKRNKHSRACSERLSLTFELSFTKNLDSRANNKEQFPLGFDTKNTPLANLLACPGKIEYQMLDWRTCFLELPWTCFAGPVACPKQEPSKRELFLLGVACTSINPFQHWDTSHSQVEDPSMLIWQWLLSLSLSVHLQRERGGRRRPKGTPTFFWSLGASKFNKTGLESPRGRQI